MKAQGIFAVVFIFGVALAMSGYSVWHHFQQGRKIRVFWGPETAHLIRHAPQVDLLVLKRNETPGSTKTDFNPSEPKPELATFGAFSAERSLDISAARGLVHSRHSLIIDDGFVWDDTTSTAEAHWEYAERFVDGQKTVTLLYDFRQERVRMAETGKEIQLKPWLAQGMKAFFSELISPEKSAAASATPGM